MKRILTVMALFIAQFVAAQHYDAQLNKAGEALQKKDFCTALTAFKEAFKEKDRIGTYDLAYASVAAANCNDETQALAWLSESQRKGLGLNPGEADAIANDSAFVKLRQYPEWASFVSGMRRAFDEKQAMAKKRSEEWLAAINANRVAAAQKGEYAKCKPGFALYFSKKDSVDVPYLVYVPKTYDPAKPTTTIVYLHGGVLNTESFNYSNPDIGQGEPVFSVGDSFNALVVYPFGKKDFGWVAQKAAFENVLSIVARVKAAYHVDSKNIVLGGMSNGGTAAFWFASQKPNLFSGFYAFSALPRLAIGNMNFANMAQNKPFHTLHTKDDDVFKYDEVAKIYADNRQAAKDWRFETLATGGHGFIYQQGGAEAMRGLFEKLLSKAK